MIAMFDAVASSRRTTIFVGGPIQYAIRDGRLITDLRVVVERLLAFLESSGFRVLSAHRYEQYGEVDVEGQHMTVTRRDFGWMNECHAFIALLPNDNNGAIMRTDGTCIEIGWAAALGKPLIVVRELDAPHSHLIKGLAAVAACREVAMADIRRDPSIVLGPLREVLDNGSVVSVDPPASDARSRV